MNYLQKASLTLILSLFVASTAHAINWSGAVDTDFHTGGNWVGGVVPDSSLVINQNASIVPSANTAIINADVYSNHFFMSGGNAELQSGTLLTTQNNNGTNRGFYFFNGGGTFTQNGGSVISAYGPMSHGYNSNDPNSPQGGGGGSYVLNAGYSEINQFWGYSLGGRTGGDFTFDMNGGELSGNRIALFGEGVGSRGIFDMSGGEATVSGQLRNINPRNINGPVGGTGDTEGIFTFTGGSLDVGQMLYDDPTINGDNPITVGAGSTLALGDVGNHTITDGLDILNGGTLATGDNAVEAATFDAGAVTIASGANILYSIAGISETSDEFIFGATSSLTLDANHSYNLIVEVVNGDVKQSDGPFDIFSGNVNVINGTFDQITWNISAAEGTRLASEGSVSFTGGIVQLSGFEAFSIPEPSTTMLLGMGAVVMLLRRRIRR